MMVPRSKDRKWSDTKAREDIMAAITGADFNARGEKIRVYYADGMVREKVQRANGYDWVVKSVEQLEAEKRMRLILTAIIGIFVLGIIF